MRERRAIAARFKVKAAGSNRNDLGPSMPGVLNNSMVIGRADMQVTPCAAFTMFWGLSQ
jgi:hypothetical protein